MKYLKKMGTYVGTIAERLFDFVILLIPGVDDLLGAAYHRVYEPVSPPSPDIRTAKPSIHPKHQILDLVRPVNSLQTAHVVLHNDS
jgi:hypothetical protein